MSGLGYYDEQKIETIVRQQTKTQFDDAARRDRQMIEAMGGIASALKELTSEIKGLRADLNPALDKPVRLSAPKTQGGP